MEDMPSTEELTDRERAILAFESRPHRDIEGDIRKTFRMSPARYYQVMHKLIEKPSALAYDPQLVKRLIRARDRRIQARAARTF